MSVRVSPTEKIRRVIDALFEDGIDLAEKLEQVARLGARLIMQKALEVEVDEFLGRARYQRTAGIEDAREGSRNGFCPTTIKTTAGAVTLQRPKLRGATEKFASRLFGAGVTRTNALESFAIAGYVRGLSDRDVEATLADALGAEAALSKSTVSRVCEAIKEQFATWAERRLADLELDYLFRVGWFFKMHAGARAEPVLAAWGITTKDAPVLIGWLQAERSPPTPGRTLDRAHQSRPAPTPAVRQRGCPWAARGLGAGVPRSRCGSVGLIHRSRNLLAKVPAQAQTELKNAYWKIFDLDDEHASELAPGPDLVASRRPASTCSPTPTNRATPAPSSVCSPTASSSPATCGSPSSTTAGSGTATSSSAPSGRPDDG